MARSYTPSNFYIEERFQDPSLPGTHGIVRRRASTPSPRETPTLSAGETPRTRRLCGASPRVELATNGKKQTGRCGHRPRPPSRAAVPERRPAGCPAHTPVIGRRNRLPGRGWVASSSSASRAAQRRASSPTERSMSAVTADTAGLIAACFAPSVVRTRRPKTAPNPPSGGEIRVGSRDRDSGPSPRRWDSSRSRGEQRLPGGDPAAVPRRSLADERPFGVLGDIAQTRADPMEGWDVGVGALEVRDEVVAPLGCRLGRVLVGTPE